MMLRQASRQVRSAAFTLLEVLIAMAIFFVAILAILELTVQSVGSARYLQTAHLDISSLASMMSLTNRVEEGEVPREIIDLFQNANPEYGARGNIFEVSSNGLFQVDFEIYGVKGKKVAASTFSMLLYRPQGAGRFRNPIRR